MRMLVSLFTMIVAATLPATVLASIAAKTNPVQPTNQSATQPTSQLQAANQQPAIKQPTNAPVNQTVANMNQATQPRPADEVLLPGSQIVAGNPDNNEFFIIGKNQPTPPELIEERKRAEEHVRPVQVAIDEAKKLQEMKAPIFEKTPTPSPIAVQAANNVNPDVNNMLAPPVLTDATVAMTAPKKELQTTDATKALTKSDKPEQTTAQVKTKTLTSKTTKTTKTVAKSIAKVATDKKTLIKHVYSAPATLAKTDKPVVVPAETHKAISEKKVTMANAKAKTPAVTKQKPIDVKALLAKVEVVKPTKAKTITAKQPAPKKVHLSLAKTKEEVKHGHIKFKVKTVTVD